MNTKPTPQSIVVFLVIAVISAAIAIPLAMRATQSLENIYPSWKDYMVILQGILVFIMFSVVARLLVMVCIRFGWLKKKNAQ